MILLDKIIHVLSQDSKPMGYEEIAVELAEQGKIAAFGVMPRKQIRTVIDSAILQEGDGCPIVTTYPGEYLMRKNASPAHLQAAKRMDRKLGTDRLGIITCFGHQWLRERVIWKPKTEIFGCQFQKSPRINFADQTGFYVLYSEDRSIEYIDYTGDRNLGDCLYEHTLDRLDGRWERFSFFCLKPINDDGTLGPLPVEAKIGDVNVMASMKSILLELAEPRSNRRHYDYFSTLIFIQWRNPQIEIKRELDKYVRKLLQ
ncbi:MAG: hypothetical protein EHM38_03830 [Geobacteraceae bacterium]|nr:MAG: hypothetical protein EHM38_03830 [Geobacteraceae bacterium]